MGAPGAVLPRDATRPDPSGGAQTASLREPTPRTAPDPFSGIPFMPSVWVGYGFYINA